MVVDITNQFVAEYGLESVQKEHEALIEMAASKKQTTQGEEVVVVTETVVEAIPEVQELSTVVARKFDPLSKLITVKGGAKYLQVRDRLIWLREEHPEAEIKTHLENYYPDEKMWVVKAEITIWVHANDSYTTARGSGLGQETERDFPAGALEKAETKAIGRALATLGFGTQFALEYEEGNLADTAVQHQRQQPTNGKISAAGVEELREDVIAMLEVDTDAAEKLPKGAGEMTENELSKLATWLRLRANR